MHFPAKAAGTESPVRSKVVSFKRRFYHAIYQSFRPGNGGEPGLRLRCDGADARRRGRPAGGRHRRRCRGARYPQPQREGTSRQKRGQRDYPGGDGTARGIRKTRAGRGYDPRKIAPGSGIGSSAASSAAAVWGVNELLGRPFQSGSWNLR
ncbi:MAG: hypothetical protein ACLT1W_06760 [Alistipes onderdonkii]